MIKVYGLPNCVACEATKKALDSKGLFYSYQQMTDADLSRFKEMGYLSAPIIEAELDGQEIRWSGFRPDLILKLSNELEMSEK